MGLHSKFAIALKLLKLEERNDLERHIATPSRLES